MPRPLTPPLNPLSVPRDFLRSLAQGGDFLQPLARGGDFTTHAPSCSLPLC